MTNPTITYGHGFLTDCNDTTGWVKTEDGNTCTFAAIHDDIFMLWITASENNKICYISYPDEDEEEDLNISSNEYPTIYWRYKTLGDDIKAKIVLLFDGWDPAKTEAQNITAGNGQIVLPETNSDSLFLVGSETITASKIVDHIRLYANQAEGYVYYDFILICKGTFTFPNTAHGLEFTPPPRYATIPIPSRIGDITQNLGNESATVTASCNLDVSNATDDWKRPQGILSKGTSGDVVNGQVFIDIAHNSNSEPFQWLTAGKRQFKATLETPRFPERGDEHTLDLLFREYRRRCASYETYVERFGLNL